MEGGGLYFPRLDFSRKSEGVMTSRYFDGNLKIKTTFARLILGNMESLPALDKNSNTVHEGWMPLGENQGQITPSKRGQDTQSHAHEQSQQWKWNGFVQNPWMQE